MNRQGRRVGFSWLLLSVFVSMLLLSGVHRHEVVDHVAIDCVECAHHVHHHGHLSASDNYLDDCLLCQFFHFVYMVAAITALIPFANFSQIRRCVLKSRTEQRPPLVLYTRGPPLDARWRRSV
ncbi:MAG: hypothetical protein J5770_04585 [Bacteroidaceae bacterium]|nr:hypothetical protein [Bacteroidaceae bacterium]